MLIQLKSIIPLTKARTILSDLVKRVKNENFIVLTKGGEPTAAIVDINYLKKLEEDASKVYSKTFIDPKLVKHTRIFSDDEIERWQKEDQI
jgi:prevent-host-death family protein